MSTESKNFKDWFDKKAASALAAQVSRAMPDFDREAFEREATRKLTKLEMKGRVKQFAEALRNQLPESIPAALDVLVQSLPAPMPDCERVTDGWLQWPVGQFIAEYAVEHFDPAMKAMYALTQRFSSEFAIRPFAERYPDRVFAQLLAWSSDPSPHVRRWCSEGIRPRLPWGARLSRLIEDPAPIFPILHALRDDPELYVRRSVANNLNDIAKDHPERVLALLESWRQEAGAERIRLIRHATRTMVKQGHPRALALFGFEKPKSLDVEFSVTPKRVRIGGSVTLKLGLKNRSGSKQNLMIDFVVHYVLANGRSGPKVFKWTQKELPVADEFSASKKFSLKPTSIRTLRGGVHRVELQVNGVRLAETEFRLTE